MMTNRIWWLAGLLALAACKTPSATSGVEGHKRWTPADAAEGVQTPALAELLRGYWGWRLETSPIFATMIGVHRYDDRIADNSPEGLERERSEQKAWLASAQGIDPSSMQSAEDRLTLELLIEELESEVGVSVCRFEEWSLSPRGNPVTEWSYLPELHRVKTPADMKNLIARYRVIAGSIDHETGHLRRGAAKGWYANAESTRRLLEMVDQQLEKPTNEWPLVKDVKTPEGDEANYAAGRAELARLVESAIRPALLRYRDFIRDEIAPHARPPEASGLGALSMGKACYAASVRRHTTLTHDASLIHQIGLKEIEKLDRQIQALGQELFGTKTLAATLEKLRTDPSLYFEDEAQVRGKAESMLAAAKAAIPNWFGRLPKADCVVSVIPDYEAPYTTIAYYRPAIPDGSKPGEYFINTYEPKTRPRYEAAALAVHEAIPGHHLQIAIAQELPATPAFRKHLGLNSFVEGWALYTERLADEMGLYEDDLDRMGMLSYQAWRASRLVVDTGIHALGWSRQQAVDFMLAHTALARNNIENEVDRYIVWPGQALGYMLGQLEILGLRKDAEKALGDRFDIKAFHDAVLTRGAVSLKALKLGVWEWVKAQRQVATEG